VAPEGGGQTKDKGIRERKERMWKVNPRPYVDGVLGMPLLQILHNLVLRDLAQHNEVLNSNLLSGIHGFLQKKKLKKLKKLTSKVDKY